MLKSSFFILLCFAFGIFGLKAQYSATTAVYNQDFTGLSTGGFTTVSLGDLGTRNSSLNGWFFLESGTGADYDIIANNGASGTVNTYNYGVTSNTDRSLGTLRSSSFSSTIGFYFKNTTGSTVTSLSITYTGKTWRVGMANRSDRLDFQYSTNATTLSSGTWTDYNALDYQNNGAAISTGLSQYSIISSTLTGLNIANNSSFYIRWTDVDAAGNDDGMAVDNFTLKANTSNVYSNPTNYFRSNTVSGNWSSPSSWQSSSDNSTWITATLEPTGLAAGVYISNGNKIIIDRLIAAKLLQVTSRGFLSYSTNGGWSVSIFDDGTSAIDFIVSSGAQYELYGKQPVFSTGAKAEIYGTVKVMDNSGSGESDDFAMNTNVLFKTSSVFLWHTTTQFTTASATYFAGSGYANEKPIFKVDIVSGALVNGNRDTFRIGANSTTTFNGKFEVNIPSDKTVKFDSAGTKIFRDGLGGSGRIWHDYTCGTFLINGSDAYIDGSLNLDIVNNPDISTELEIPTGAFLTVKNSPVINIGKNIGSSWESDCLIDGVLKHTGSLPIYIYYCYFTINGELDASSTGYFNAGSAGSKTHITIGGTQGGSAGVLRFTSAYQELADFTMQRTGSGAKVIMGSDVKSSNFTLISGIIATGYNLVTWLNDNSIISSKIISPNSPWTINNSTYSNSYIATCDENGTPIVPNNNTWGFRINNLGGGTDYYFPVGANFNSANRIMINNSGTMDNFTVVVNVGDIANTPAPVVERIWYVTEGSSGGSKVEMKLFFTKRDPLFYPSSSNDEVETGFDYSDMHLIQENYSNKFVNNSTGSDVLFSLASATPPGSFNMGTEMYGQYTFTSNPGNGITGFTRFAVVNQQTFILPVTLTNFKAYSQNSQVKTEWTSLNEIEVNHYEIERASNAANFISLGSIPAKNNSTENHYSWIDVAPLNGNNFYRIKAVDQNGNITYTQIINISFNNTSSLINIYPNPVKDHQVNLKFSNLQPGNYTLQVYSFNGAILFFQSIQYSGGSAGQTIQLPLSIKAGTYIIRLSNGNNNYTNRLLVQ